MRLLNKILGSLLTLAGVCVTLGFVVFEIRGGSRQPFWADLSDVVVMGLLPLAGGVFLLGQRYQFLKSTMGLACCVCTLVFVLGVANRLLFPATAPAMLGPIAEATLIGGIISAVVWLAAVGGLRTRRQDALPPPPLDAAPPPPPLLEQTRAPARMAQISPLGDPLRGLGAALTVMILLAAVFTFVPLPFGFHEGPHFPPLSALPMILGPFLIWVGILVLVFPARSTNAYYLRAFRTDARTVSLRREIRALLGSGFRLSGIRPPRERSGWVIRGMFRYWFMLRYAGSKFMDLEAGNDWLLRLWRSYAKARVVFIDVRSMTQYVHTEIQLSYRCMGDARCIFIVDPGQGSTAEWRKLLAGILEVEPAQTDQLIVAGYEDTPLGRHAFAETVRAAVAALPPGRAGLATGVYGWAAQRAVLDRLTTRKVLIGILQIFLLIMGMGIAGIGLMATGSIGPTLLMVVAGLLPILLLIIKGFIENLQMAAAYWRFNRSALPAHLLSTLVVVACFADFIWSVAVMEP